MNQNDQIEAARLLQTKLSKYLELHEMRSKIEAEIAELERDAALQSALGIAAGTLEDSRSQTTSVSEQKVDFVLTTSGPDRKRAHTAVVELKKPKISLPRSESGRIQRGFLDQVVPSLVERRFGSTEVYTAREIRDVIAEEFAADDIGVNTVQALLDRLVEAGKAEEIGSQRPKLYKIPSHQSSDEEVSN